MSKLSYVVEPLHPFTEYVFRVVWIFTAQLHLYSPPSPSYRTHPYGGRQTHVTCEERMLFRSFGFICFYFKAVKEMDSFGIPFSLWALLRVPGNDHNSSAIKAMTPALVEPTFGRGETWSLVST